MLSRVGHVADKDLSVYGLRAGRDRRSSSAEIRAPSLPNVERSLREIAKTTSRLFGAQQWPTLARRLVRQIAVGRADREDNHCGNGGKINSLGRALALRGEAARTTVKPTVPRAFTAQTYEAGIDLGSPASLI